MRGHGTLFRGRRLSIGMSRRTQTLLIVVSIMALGALWLARRPDTSPTDARRLVAAGAKLVDVRSPEEFAAGHLPGARNIPVDELTSRLEEIGPRDLSVVVYCATGGRSASAARLLAGAGFTQVHNLGPMSAW